MLRLPNPGSDIDNFIRIFHEIFEALNSRESFSLDDMSSTLVERNLATSCGFTGQRALLVSTRRDRSRDPLYNQSKMYSELFRALGWIHPLKQKQLNFHFTYLGAHVVAARQDPVAIFEESALGIAYPSEILRVKGNYQLRPFATILRTLGALDGLLSRDELIIGPMCLDDDRNNELFSNMIKEIQALRGYWQTLDNKMKEIAEQRNISPNTMKNYTRFPLAVLRWTGWTKEETNQTIYDKAMKFDKLTDKGYKVLEMIEGGKDVRKSDLEQCDRSTRSAIIKHSFYQMLERAGFDTKPVTPELAKDKTLVTSYLKSTSHHLLFSPFQEISSDYLLSIFPNSSGNETPKMSEDSSISATYAEIPEALYSNVELKPTSGIANRIGDPTSDYQSDAESKNSNVEILDLFKKLIAQYENLEAAIEPIVTQYVGVNKDVFYPLIANLLKAIGYDCRLSQTGVNYQRWDALINDQTHSIPIEIKSPGEEEFLSVKGIRQALENKVVLLARGGYPTEFQDTSLVVCYNLPNNRSEVNLLINDVSKAYNIIIGVVDFRNLLKIVGSQLFFKKEHSEEQLQKLHGIIKLSNS